jgi:hypothetical protein
MAGYTRNDTSNNIATGNIINSADLDGEFDALQSAFVATTGHNHDGTTGSGAPISTLGPTQEVVVTTTTIRPSADNTIDLGTSLLEFKDLYIDGTANIDSLVADTADINGGTIDNATIATSDITVGSGKTLNVSAGTLTLANDQISGDKVEGGTINATTITTLTSTTVNAATVNTTNIEVTALKAKDGTTAGTVANTTGVVTLTSLVATTADINGGTVDGTTVGASVPAAGTFTTLSSTGTATLNAMNTGSATITGGSISGITDLAVADGGTGVSTLTGIVKGNGTSAFSAATAGTDFLAPAAVGTTVQAWDTNLDQLAGLTPSLDNFIVGSGTAWVAKTHPQALVSLGVTATAAELNALDGITASTTELNILDGVTATAAELNTLDGITASTTELNILDGVTVTASDINNVVNKVPRTSTTGAALIPSGTEAERPTPATGQLRFNTDATSFEGYNGTEWGSISGKPFLGNSQFLTTDTTLTSADDRDLLVYSNAIDITLPAVSEGLVFGIVNASTGIGTIITPNPATKIGRANGRVVLYSGEEAIVVCDGVGWQMIGADDNVAVRFIQFSSSGTYVPNPGAKLFLACVNGATGGTRTGSSTDKGGSGGGGYSEKLYTAPFSASYAVTIGAGGGASGGTGGTTTFDTISIASSAGNSTGTGTSGGVGTGGDFNATGGTGGNGTNDGGGGGGGSATRAGNGGNGANGAVSLGGGGGGTGGNNASGGTGGIAATSENGSVYSLATFMTAPVFQAGSATITTSSTSGAYGATCRTDYTAIGSSGTFPNIGATSKSAGAGGRAFSSGFGGFQGQAGHATIVEFF